MHGHCNSPFTINSRFNIWLDWRDTANKLLLVGRNVVSSLIMQKYIWYKLFFVKGITFIIWTHRRGSKMINRFLNYKIEMKRKLMRVWKHWRLYKRHNAHNILRYWLYTCTHIQNEKSQEEKYVSTKYLEYQIAVFACIAKINHSFSTLKV